MTFALRFFLYPVAKVVGIGVKVEMEIHGQQGFHWILALIMD